MLQLEKCINDEDQVFLTGIILTEILQGVREPQQAVKIRRHLEAFSLLELDRAGYVRAAELSSQLRKKGFQSGTVDLLIAQIAIANDCFLLTADKDFTYIASYSPLKLL